MSIDIINEYSGEAPGFISEDEYTLITDRVISLVLDREACPYETEVSVLLTDDENIRKINLKERNKDESTDVLSFPMIAFKSPACFDRLDGDISLFDPDTGELVLGDIVISIDHCILQAARYGHDVTREYAFLIAHSMFHLLGYDHKTQETSICMEEKQEAILEALGFVR